MNNFTVQGTGDNFIWIWWEIRTKIYGYGYFRETWIQLSITGFACTWTRFSSGWTFQPDQTKPVKFSSELHLNKKSSTHRNLTINMERKLQQQNFWPIIIITCFESDCRNKIEIFYNIHGNVPIQFLNYHH